MAFENAPAMAFKKEQQHKPVQTDTDNTTRSPRNSVTWDLGCYLHSSSIPDILFLCLLNLEMPEVANCSRKPVRYWLLFLVESRGHFRGGCCEHVQQSSTACFFFERCLINFWCTNIFSFPFCCLSACAFYCAFGSVFAYVMVLFSFQVFFSVLYSLLCLVPYVTALRSFVFVIRHSVSCLSLV